MLCWNSIAVLPKSALNLIKPLTIGHSKVIPFTIIVSLMTYLLVAFTRKNKWIAQLTLKGLKPKN